MKGAFFILLSFVGSALLAQDALDTLLESHPSPGIPYISVTEARMLQLHKKAILLDTRTQEEFEVSKIPTAHLIGSTDFSPMAIQKIVRDKNTLIIVYCSVGIRSQKIAQKLKKLGYTHVKNLYGGIFEWKNEDFPIVDQEGKETERIHTYSKYWGKYLKKGIKVE